MSEWVLILGCSTGHGGATTRKLAKNGYGIIGFHFDRGDIKKEAESFCEELKGLNGGRVHFFNKNAADTEVMKEFLPKIEQITGGDPLKLFLHSIAFGTTTNFFGEHPVTRKQMDMTVHVMGTSILYWVQQLFDSGLLGKGSRVLGPVSYTHLTLPTRDLV